MTHCDILQDAQMVQISSEYTVTAGELTKTQDNTVSYCPFHMNINGF